MHSWCSPLAAQGYLQLGEDIFGEKGWDRSGSAVSASGNGNIVAIGAVRQNIVNEAESCLEPGYTRLFTWEDGSWQQMGQAILGTANCDGFGTDISLSHDGTVIAVGAMTPPSTTVYEYNPYIDAWSVRGEPILNAANDAFKAGLSLSSDGNTLAIGSARGVESGDPGYVRVFVWDGNAWTQQGQTIEVDSSGVDRIDNRTLNALSLSGNGKTLALGAPVWGEQDDHNGRTRVYQFDGVAWLPLGDPITGARGEEVGYSVALSHDGSIVAVGARQDDFFLTAPGVVRVYQHNGHIWKQIGADISGSNIIDWACFVSLSADGLTLLVGAPGRLNYEDRSGYASIYEFVNSSWALQSVIPANSDDANNSFGLAISLSADGRTAVVADPTFTDEANFNATVNSGQTRIFRQRDSLSPGILWFITRGSQVDADAP